MTRALLIDIGNSRIKWCRDDLARPALAASLERADVDEDGRGQQDDAVAVPDASSLASRWASVGEVIDAAWISNVASPSVGEVVAEALRTTWPGIRIGCVRSTAREGDLVNGYAEPAQLGTDRWMAALGAHAALPTYSLLVCSFGTATTIDLIDRVFTGSDAGRTPLAKFVGGLILPGSEAMRGALVNSTARLPDRTGQVVDFADNTTDAIASGIVAAQSGAVLRTLRDARRAVSDRPLGLMITGGAGRRIAPHLQDLEVPCWFVADLVLRGLAVRARGAAVTYDASAACDPTHSTTG